MYMMRRVIGLIFLICLLGLVMACGDDDVQGLVGQNGNGGSGDDQDCPEGQVYNPLTESCVDGSSDDPDNDDPDNDDPDNDDPDNGDPDNGDPDNGDPTGPPGCEYATLIGQTCGTDGEFLGHAQVRVVGEDCDGEPFERSAQANEHGLYSIDQIPPGDHTLIVESGSFSGSEPVTLQPGQTKDLMAQAKKSCISADGVEIAVIDGEWDDVSTLLDGMQIDYTPYTALAAESLLNDLSAMQQYDIIFIECHAWNQTSLEGTGGFSNQVQSNIRNYVESGNSLYASDQAQGFIQQGLPEAITFYRESEGVTGPRQGAQISSLATSVESNAMQGVLGSTTTSLAFSLEAWSIAESASHPNSTVHFQAAAPIMDSDPFSPNFGQPSGQTVPNAPLMVHFEADGGGSAIFTSFHNSDQATGDMQDILEFAIYQL